MATLDVTDAPYGANGDGTGNDAGAIQDAINDAQPGDTVYLPAGTYAIQGRETIIAIDDNVVSSDFTIEGDGPDTLVRYEGGNGGSNFFIFRLLNGPTGVEIRDMIIDGNRDVVSGDPVVTQCIGMHRGDGRDVLVENVVGRNAWRTAFSIRNHGITFRNCTAENNGAHGWDFRVSHTAPDNPFVIENCRATGNAVVHWGHYGIDVATGSFVVRDTVIDSNGAGTKTSHTDEVDGLYQRVRVRDNSGIAYQSTNGNYGTVVFEDCVFANNAGQMRLSFIDYEVDGELVVTGNSDNGIYTTDGGNIVSADEIWCNNNSGAGLTGGPGTIDVYNHANNGGGAGGGGYSIREANSAEKTDLDAVPTAEEVGAWTNGNGGDDGDDGDEEPDEREAPAPAGALVTNGGVIHTAGGVITTLGSSLQRVTGTVVDDFEGYTPGTPLEETDAWTAAGDYTANHVVTDDVAATGDQSVVVAGASPYNAIQSNEGDGLNEYPAADCTIRIAVYLEAGSHDVAFGVPADEDNYHLNCYRLRGGPFLTRNPSLKRTVDGQMEVLVSLDNHFPTDTWLEHVIEFESTGSEVILTYHGYAWDATDGEWVQFESGTQGVDQHNSFPDEAGVGLGTYAVSDTGTAFDQFRVDDLGVTGPPSWTPVHDSL